MSGPPETAIHKNGIGSTNFPAMLPELFIEREIRS
jgi:hypothetical protein